MVWLFTVVPAIVTEILPELAAAGTTATMLVGEMTENVAGAPLNFTADAPERLTPVIVTDVPTVALAGVIAEIDGGRPKAATLVAVPSGVVTVI